MNDFPAWLAAALGALTSGLVGVAVAEYTLWRQRKADMESVASGLMGDLAQMIIGLESASKQAPREGPVTPVQFWAMAKAASKACSLMKGLHAVRGTVGILGGEVVGRISLLEFEAEILREKAEEIVNSNISGDPIIDAERHRLYLLLDSVDGLLESANEIVRMLPVRK